jgi:hypothetical protein
MFKADFEAGLVSEVSEWLDRGEDEQEAWWIQSGVERHLRLFTNS